MSALITISGLVTLYFIHFIIRKTYFKKDPVINCELYKDKGCNLVDGVRCTYPDCPINDRYLDTKYKYNELNDNSPK